MEQDDIKTDKLNLSIWKDFFQYLTPYKKDFIRLIFMMVGLGLLDTIFPLLSKYAVDNFVEKKTIEGLGGFAVVYFIATLLLAFLVYKFISSAGRLETKMAYDIRRIGFEKLQLLPLSYYDHKAIGWLMARMTSDITRLSETISWGLVDMSWGITMMSGVTVAMLILNWKLALITLSVLPFVALVSIYFQKKI